MAQPPHEIDFHTRINFAYGEPREIAPGVLRIVANNPSPWTFKGTNTYILGTDKVAIIDPGPDDPAHLDAVVRAVAGRPVSHIVITHNHRDHTDGLARVREATRARVYAHGHKVAPRPAGESAGARRGEGADRSLVPDVELRDGSVIDGDGFRLTALFTPGHAPDHLCFAVEGTGMVFSGDHVMGWSTSVVAPPEGRMVDYLASLERLIGRGDTLYLPGHGGKLSRPERSVRAYILHRRWREEAILDAIRNGHSTIDAVVSLVYRDLDPRLLRAASLSVQAHVEHLKDRGLVSYAPPLTFDQPLSASS